MEIRIFTVYLQQVTNKDTKKIIKTSKTMETKKITARLSFNEEELEILNAALNEYALKMMRNSTTWGNAEAMMERGEDYYHEIARKTERMWCSVYDAQKRVRSREKQEPAFV